MSSAPTHNNLVSVAMPVKNAATFLPDTLQSISDQEWENWELIAVDDHSTDESRDILDDFSKRDARVKWVPNIGHGILPALQTATDRLCGNFISRMDADDLMTPRRMSSQIELLQEKGRGHICTGKVKYISTAGNPGEGFCKYEAWLNSLCNTGTHYREIYKECVIPSPAWMMHMDDFRKTGGFSQLEYPEDYDFVFRLYAKGIKVVSVPEVVLKWRDHPDRASRNLPQYRDQTFYSLKWKWFKKLEYHPNKKLILYGAGPKGKKLARLIIESQLPFEWISGNPNKTGHDIYGKVIKTESELTSSPDAAVIVAVSAPTSRAAIQKNLSGLQSVYYFC